MKLYLKFLSAEFVFKIEGFWALLLEISRVNAKQKRSSVLVGGI